MSACKKGSEANLTQILISTIGNLRIASTLLGLISANATMVSKATKIPNNPTDSNTPTDSNAPTIHATMCVTDILDDGILVVDVHLSVYPVVRLVVPYKQMLSLKKALRITASI